jgi:branched-chain amino acid aminotransferase
VADELFLTGTAAEIVPIVEVDARKIGDGKPGKITAKFLDAFRRRASVEGTMLY